MLDGWHTLMMLNFSIIFIHNYSERAKLKRINHFARTMTGLALIQSEGQEQHMTKSTVFQKYILLCDSTLAHSLPRSSSIVNIVTIIVVAVISRTECTHTHTHIQIYTAMYIYSINVCRAE